MQSVLWSISPDVDIMIYLKECHRKKNILIDHIGESLTPWILTYETPITWPWSGVKAPRCCCFVVVVVVMLVAQSCLALWDPTDCSLLAPLIMGFSRQDYWSGLPFPSPEDLPDQGSKLGHLHCRQILYHLSFLAGIKGRRYKRRSYNARMRSPLNYQTISIILIV